MTNQLPVAVIGAGPVGLAAVAHLLERGETPIVFESGDSIGANLREWSHIRMFSPWQYVVDKAAVRMLEAHGWEHPPADGLPTGGDLRDDYLLPFANLPEVKSHIHLSAKVVAISRSQNDKMRDANRENSPFVLHVVYGNGDEAHIEARAVIDASGTWNTPNPLGGNGLPAIGEKRYSGKIFYGIPAINGEHASRYANKRVMVVGNGHSATNALLELATLRKTYPKTEVFWVMRSKGLNRVYGGGADDELSARGQLGERLKSNVGAGMFHIVAPFFITEIKDENNAMVVIGKTPNGMETVVVDEIISTTGSRPNLDMLRELRLDIDHSLESVRALAPVIDPNLHSCGTVPPHGEAELRHPEPNFYIVGMKSYGRAPTFLLLTGYEQVRSVVAMLAGDIQAAQMVELVLPETGVCGVDDGSGGGCCGTSNSSVTIGFGEIAIGNKINN